MNVPRGPHTLSEEGFTHVSGAQGSLSCESVSAFRGHVGFQELCVCECSVQKHWAVMAVVLSSPGLTTSPRTAFLVCLREGTGDVLPSEVEDGGKQQLF